MNSQVSTSSLATGSTEDVKLRFAQHVEQQAAPTQALHRWMVRLEVASLGLIVLAFIAAIWVSVFWRT